MSLKPTVTLLPINEFRTSKCCSECGTETEKVKEWVTIWNRSKGEMERKLRDIYAIGRCTNNECRITWERDINAASNIRSLLLHRLRKEARPTFLCRQPKKKRSVKDPSPIEPPSLEAPPPPKTKIKIKMVVKQTFSE